MFSLFDVWEEGKRFQGNLQTRSHDQILKVEYKWRKNRVGQKENVYVNSQLNVKYVKSQINITTVN